MGTHVQDMHYQCILRLTGNALAHFLQHIQTVDDGWCRKALKQLKPEETAEAPPIEGDPLDEIEQEAPELPPLLPAVLDRSVLEWHRVQVHVDGKTFRVVFSHLNSAQDQQRAYCNCLNPAHGDCVRWRMCSQFRDRSACAAYMAAWALEGEDTDSRETHMQQFEPTAEFIEAVAEGMTLSEW